MRSLILSILFCLLTNDLTRAQDAAAKLPYKVTPDVVYGHKDGMALTFDVFEPTENAKGVGLLLMVSGGWVSSWMPPERSVAFFQPLLKEGYTVLTVRHGSSPKYVIPEISDDVRLAHKYIHEHATELNIDPQRLGVFGFSAGGHLSLLLGTKSNDQSNGPRIAAVVAVFPPTDLGPYVEPSNPMREKFPALKFEASRASDFSPLKQITQDDAPTLLVHGDKDELVPIWHSEKLKASMQECNVPCELIVIKDAAHGFDAEGNKTMFLGMLKWFDQHLSKKN